MKYAFAVVFGSGITFIAGLALLQQQVIKDWLQRHRVDLQLLSDAAPSDASRWLATGWALAGGIGFGVLLPNLTSLFGANEEAIVLGTAAVFLLPCAVLTVYFMVLRRGTLNLEYLWGVLAWVHYRPILSDLLSRSRARLDFVTHCGADLMDRLVRTGAKDLAFRLTDDKNALRLGPIPNMIIADLDILESIEKALRKGTHPSQLLPLREWQLRTPLGTVFGGLPGSQDWSSAKYLPIRWGFNSLTVVDIEHRLCEDFHNVSISDLPPVDVAALLETPERSPLRKLWADGLCPTILLLDWYLPNMAVLAQCLGGLTAWSEADGNHVKMVNRGLENLGQLLERSARDNNIPVSSLFCSDVVTLQQRALEAKSAVVFVGGNFLWCENSYTLNPDNVFHFPFLIDGTARCLWWQECLYVPFTGLLHGEGANWRSEIHRIVTFLRTRLAAKNSLMRFHGYLPETVRSGFDDNPSYAAAARHWRTFALNHAFPRSTHASADEVWSDSWKKWRQRWLNDQR